MTFTTHRGRLCIFINSGVWTHRRFLNRELLYQMSYIATYYDVLPQLLHDLLSHKIQHTMYLSSCGLLSRSSRSTYNVRQPLELRTTPWLQHLGTIHYPFSYKLASWFWSEVSTTCYSLVAHVPRNDRSQNRRVNINSFHFTCFTITTTRWEVMATFR